MGLALLFGFSSGDDLLGDIRWNRFIMTQFHRVASLSTGNTFELRIVLGDLRERYLSTNRGEVSGEHFLALDASAFAGDIASYFADKFHGHSNLDVHDGLKQDWLGLHKSFLESLPSGDLKSNILRIHRVRFAINQENLYIDNGIAG